MTNDTDADRLAAAAHIMKLATALGASFQTRQKWIQNGRVAERWHLRLIREGARRYQPIAIDLLTALPRDINPSGDSLSRRGRPRKVAS